MAKIAFYTFALLIESRKHPRNQEYFTLANLIFGHASERPGFLSFPESEDGDVPPRGCSGCEENHLATLTLWQDLESVFAFAYLSLHADAMRRRQEWFRPSELPNYVAWWVEDEHMPTWAEAVERYDHLAASGPAPFAFTFKTAFTAEGSPLTIKRPGRA